MAKEVYTISKEAGRFIDAARAVSQAREIIFEALTGVYGEKAGDQLFNEFAAMFDPITKKLGAYVVDVEVEENFI